jgi:hypothetical protein
MSLRLFSFILAAGLVLAAGSIWAQNDPINKVDTVTLVVQNLAAGKWVVSAQVWNDEEIAALDIPIKYTAGVAKLKVDSVAYGGTRMEKFAQKYNPIDTTAQMMHVGGLAYMAPNQPPMAVGGGEVARIYISVYGDKPAGAFAVDTCLYPPNSTLMLVDKSAKVIVPALKITSVPVKPKE